MEREDETAQLIFNFLKSGKSGVNITNTYERLLEKVSRQELKKEICTSDDLKQYELFSSNDIFKQYII